MKLLHAVHMTSINSCDARTFFFVSASMDTTSVLATSINGDRDRGNGNIKGNNNKTYIKLLCIEKQSNHFYRAATFTEQPLFIILFLFIYF